MRGGFQIKTRLGGAQAGGNVPKTVKKILNDEVVKLAASAISLTAAEISERNLYAAAVFFQRVVSRTPLDEDYTYKGRTHRADDDAVRDFWTASYGRKRITAGEMREAYGISFLRFNDPEEIDMIHMIFRGIFSRKRGIVRSISIQNDHDRFAELEYGGYRQDATVPKKGRNYEHGVMNRHSVQAPFGMLRVTQAEFRDIALRAGTETFVRGYAQKSQRLLKVPGASKMKRLSSLIQNKTRLSADEIDEVASMMG